MTTETAKIEPTIARMSFWVGQSRLDEFAAVYAAEIAPLLSRHGLEAASEEGRPTIDGVFSRLFAVATPAALIEVRQELEKDAPFIELMRLLGARLGSGRDDGCLRYSLRLYRVPVGLAEGEELLDIRPRGRWCQHDVLGNSISSVDWMFEDRDGTLWFAADDGAYCYDSYRWKNFTGNAGLGLKRVDDILQDRDGDMWFAAERRVLRYNGQSWTTFSSADGLIDAELWRIYQDRDGHMWFATAKGVSRYDGQTWTAFSSADGLPDERVRDLGQDREGHMWFATLGGAGRWDGRTWTNFTTADGLASNYLSSFFMDRDGRLWFGSGAYGLKGNGISCYDGRTWTAYGFGTEGLLEENLHCFTQDSHGRIWVGAESGISCFDGCGWSSLTKDDGMPGWVVLSLLNDCRQRLWCGFVRGNPAHYEQQAWTIFSGTHPMLSGVLQDRNGHFWFCTAHIHQVPLMRYDGEKWIGYSQRTGLAPEHICSMSEDHQGRLWLTGTGANGGVSSYDGAHWSHYGEEDGLAGNSTISSMVDSRGHLWFGTTNESDGRGVSRFDGRRWTSFTIADGLAGNYVRAILQDSDDVYWFATNQGVSRFDGRRWTSFTIADGLAGNWVEGLLQDRDGQIWAATQDGVSYFDGQRWYSLTVEDGLPDSHVTAVFQDRDGHYWFSTTGGLCRYDGQVLQRITRHEKLLKGDVPWQIYQDTAGDLWFSCDEGICRYRPMPSELPILGIDTIVADRRYTNLTDLVLPSAVSLVVFEYHGYCQDAAASTLVYRYRLRGYEQEWQTTYQTQVEYHTLAPGNYTFEIQAVDRQLVYSAPTTVEFTLRDPREERIEALEEAVRQRTAELEAVNARLTTESERVRQALEEKERTQEALIRSESMAAIGTLVAGAAHELNNPLGAAASLVQSVQEMLEEDTAAELEEDRAAIIDNLAFSRKELNRAKEIVASLLGLSRQSQDYTEEVDLTTVVQDALRVLRNKYKRYEVSIEEEYQPELPVVLGNFAQLGQVALNLIENAVEALDTGDGQVRLRTYGIEGWVLFTCSDTGAGMSEEVRRDIFKPFVTTKAPGEGTGLGLYICHQIVDKHKGTIEVETEEGKGSIFKVALPIPST